MRQLLSVVGASAVTCFVLLPLPHHAPAQGVTRPPSADTAGICLGFSFGPWSPPLDWRAAGHAAVRDTTPTRRPGAAAAIPSGADSALLLLPSWWPVGVVVDLPTRSPAPGDTVLGRATALVADGQARPPISRVRVWRVACHRPREN